MPITTAGLAMVPTMCWNSMCAEAVPFPERLVPVHFASAAWTQAIPAGVRLSPPT
jgi:hypothetical protein